MGRTMAAFKWFFLFYQISSGRQRSSRSLSLTERALRHGPTTSRGAARMATVPVGVSCSVSRRGSLRAAPTARLRFATATTSLTLKLGAKGVWHGTIDAVNQPSLGLLEEPTTIEPAGANIAAVRDGTPAGMRRIRSPRMWSWPHAASPIGSPSASPVSRLIEELRSTPTAPIMLRDRLCAVAGELPSRGGAAQRHYYRLSRVIAEGV